MTDNPNYTPVDWGDARQLGMTQEQADTYLSKNYPAATLDGDPEWVREMTEALMTDPSSVTDAGRPSDWVDEFGPLHKIKEAGISAADVQPFTTSGYQPPASIDFFDVPEQKVPTLSELEGATIVVDGEVVGHVGKSEPVTSAVGDLFEIKDRREDPNKIVATLNSSGYLINLGDSVSHLVLPKDRGTVEEIGEALIGGLPTVCKNAVKVRWPSPAGIVENDIVSWHHADNLLVHGRCICNADDCFGRPGETDTCEPCLALDPEAPCLKDEGRE